MSTKQQDISSGLIGHNHGDSTLLKKNWNVKNARAVNNKKSRNNDSVQNHYNSGNTLDLDFKGKYEFVNGKLTRGECCNKSSKNKGDGESIYDSLTESNNGVAGFHMSKAEQRLDYLKGQIHDKRLHSLEKFRQDFMTANSSKNKKASNQSESKNSPRDNQNQQLDRHQNGSRENELFDRRFKSFDRIVEYKKPDKRFSTTHKGNIKERRTSFINKPNNKYLSITAVNIHNDFNNENILDQNISKSILYPNSYNSNPIMPTGSTNPNQNTFKDNSGDQVSMESRVQFKNLLNGVTSTIGQNVKTTQNHTKNYSKINEFFDHRKSTGSTSKYHNMGNLEGCLSAQKIDDLVEILINENFNKHDLSIGYLMQLKKLAKLVLFKTQEN